MLRTFITTMLFSAALMLPKLVAAEPRDTPLFDSLKFNHPFIIGGEDTRRGEHSEFTLVIINFLDDNGELQSGGCSGMLIAPDKVLTAAHCLSVEGTQSISVIPDFYSRLDPRGPDDMVEAETWRIHPDYDGFFDIDYDVGIVTLKRQVTSAAALVYSGESSLAGKKATTLGAGLISFEAQELPDVLQKLSTVIPSNEECDVAWENFTGFPVISPKMICQGVSANGATTCLGDSGGPLMVRLGGRKVIVGVGSFIADLDAGACTPSDVSAVYARVGSFYDFIKQESPNTQFVGDGQFGPQILQLLLD